MYSLLFQIENTVSNRMIYQRQWCLTYLLPLSQILPRKQNGNVTANKNIQFCLKESSLSTKTHKKYQQVPYIQTNSIWLIKISCVQTKFRSIGTLELSNIG